MAGPVVIQLATLCILDRYVEWVATCPALIHMHISIYIFYVTGHILPLSFQAEHQALVKAALQQFSYPGPNSQGATNTFSCYGRLHRKERRSFQIQQNAY